MEKVEIQRNGELLLGEFDDVIVVGVDIQNDFCEGGSLAIPDGASIVPKFNGIAKWVKLNNGTVILTRDWHPEKTTHFDQWPVHCVSGSRGAEFTPGIDPGMADLILSKGMGSTEDAYSGFQGRSADNQTLSDVIKQRGSKRVALLICGLATDYCVKSTALDAISNTDGNVEVIAVVDAMKAVSEDTGNIALSQMQQKGIHLVTSADILSEKVLSVHRKVVSPDALVSPEAEDKLEDISYDLDYYKLTMSNFAFEFEPDTEVTLTFHNRGNQRLMDYVGIGNLQSLFDSIQRRGFSHEELSYIRGLRNSRGNNIFSDAYLEYLANISLPKVEVRYNPEIDDIVIDTTGSWAITSFWETIIMSRVNEMYFQGYMRVNHLDPDVVYHTGCVNLRDKISILHDHPEIRFSDFGTRRRFSLYWHKFLVNKLESEFPDNFVGSSNVGLSKNISRAPVGTFAHELFMVYAALADIRGKSLLASHERVLSDWYNLYGEDYSVALSDTFGSRFFFSAFSQQEARLWRGVRHDSGDPYVFGDNLIDMYHKLGVDPMEKVLVLSDGLELHTILSLSKYFQGRINLLFGWGTNLTNDLGLSPLKIVVKATHVRDTKLGVSIGTVKLSDNPEKHTGSQELIERYKRAFGV